jgi:hypothetical protein
LETRKANKSELFNECFVILLMYHIICFFDFVPDATARYNMGTSCVIFTALNIFANFTTLLYESLGLLISKARLKYKDRQIRMLIKRRTAYAIK